MGAACAGRLAVDEGGGGVVDVFVVPVRVTRMNRFAAKAIISVSQALCEIQRAHGDRTSYGALQTSWAAWAARCIDPRITRGTPKVTTQRAHVHADVYRYVAEECEATLKQTYDDQLKAAREEVKSKLAALEAKSEGLAAEARALEAYAFDLETWREGA